MASPPAPNVTDRDAETLRELAYATRDGRFVAPLDVGGQNGSHHSATLAKLARLGYAERRQRGGQIIQVGYSVEPLRGRRGSWCYRVTPLGRSMAARNRTPPEPQP